VIKNWNIMQIPGNAVEEKKEKRKKKRKRREEKT
jgi:hypothetical protein